MCTCDRALELVSCQLDGALSDAEAEELRAHLCSCPQCAEVAQQLEDIHALFPTLEEDVPPGFHHRVMEQIAAEKIVSFPRREKRAWTSLLAAAAVFTVVVVGGGALRHLTPAAPGAAPAADAASFSGGAPAADAPVLYSAPEAAEPEQGEDAYTVRDAVGGNLPAEKATAPQAQPSAPAVPSENSPAPVVGVNPTLFGTRGATPMEEDALLQATPAPQPAGGDAPAGDILAATPVTVVEAAQLLVSTTYPQASAEPVYDEAGQFAALRLSDAEESVSLCSLGLSPNEGYYEFSLLAPAGEEENRFAVSTDGTVVMAYWTENADGILVENATAYTVAVGYPQDAIPPIPAES